MATRRALAGGWRQGMRPEGVPSTAGTPTGDGGNSAGRSWRGTSTRRCRKSGAPFCISSTPSSTPSPWVSAACGDARARPRDRREHRLLQPARHGRAPPAPLSRSRSPARRRRHGPRTDGPAGGLLAEVPGTRGAEPGDVGNRRPSRVELVAHRSRASRGDHRPPRQLGLLRDLGASGPSSDAPLPPGSRRRAGRALRCSRMPSGCSASVAIAPLSAGRSILKGGRPPSSGFSARPSASLQETQVAPPAPKRRASSRAASSSSGPATFRSRRGSRRSRRPGRPRAPTRSDSWSQSTAPPAAAAASVGARACRCADGSHWRSCCSRRSASWPAASGA